MPWGVQYYEQESWHPVIVITMSSTMPVCTWFHKDTASNPAANAALTCNKGSALGMICNKLTFDTTFCARRTLPALPMHPVCAAKHHITSAEGRSSNLHQLHPSIRFWGNTRAGAAVARYWASDESGWHQTIIEECRQRKASHLVITSIITSSQA